MALQIILAVKDRQLDGYMRPFTAQTIGQAIRSFTDETNRKDSEINQHPDDYELHHLGHFNDQTGELVKLDRPQQVAIAANLIERK